MAVTDSYKEFLLEQLEDIDNVMCKRMFGGIGFFKEGVMFGMVGGGKFRLRTDEHNAPDFEALGMTNFQPNPDKKGLPYHEVPVDILEDKRALTEWANKAIAASIRNKKK